MRASFIVGIFVVAVAAAGTMEYASRWAAGSTGTSSTETVAPGPKPAAGRVDKATAPAPPAPAADVKPEEPVDDANVVLVLGGSNGRFRANAQSLSEAMVDAIDAVFTGPRAEELACAAFVIEGHTDNLGAPEVNRQIGLSRAIAVRQHLAEHYGIPKDAMRVMSYGSDRPVGDNSTPEGRASNRRVVIKTAAHAH